MVPIDKNDVKIFLGFSASYFILFVKRYVESYPNYCPENRDESIGD